MSHRAEVPISHKRALQANSKRRLRESAPEFSQPPLVAPTLEGTEFVPSGESNGRRFASSERIGNQGKLVEIAMRLATPFSTPFSRLAAGHSSAIQCRRAAGREGNSKFIFF